MSDLSKFVCAMVGLAGMLFTLALTRYLIIPSEVLGLMGGFWLCLWLGIATLYKR